MSYSAKMIETAQGAVKILDVQIADHKTELARLEASREAMLIIAEAPPPVTSFHKASGKGQEHLKQAMENASDKNGSEKSADDAGRRDDRSAAADRARAGQGAAGAG